MKTTVYFETREYVINHGAEPRGRGSWAFSENRYGGQHTLLWFSGTFAEAKRACAAHIKALPGVSGAIFMWVQP